LRVVASEVFEDLELRADLNHKCFPRMGSSYPFLRPMDLGGRPPATGWGKSCAKSCEVLSSFWLEGSLLASISNPLLIVLE